MKLLAVPIHLDALRLEQDQSVVEAMADFSHLPYAAEQDINGSSPNISEEILSQPLQDQNFILKAGLHLHWALPDALTKGLSEEDKISFPAVPNRWLITRTDTGNNKKQWLVESDYLYPVDGVHAGISFPYKDETHPQPFRYMGRKIVLAAWQNDDQDDDQIESNYLPHLTAVGYGEPNFAAFYPNCHSVFGFYDAELPTRGTHYEVMGWYSDSEKDCLETAHFKTAIRFTKSKYPKAETPQIHYKTLEEFYGWTVANAPNVFPEQIICFAHLEIASDELIDQHNDNTEVIVALGNTGTEALSAFLAHTLEGKKHILEDQLESLHLATQLEGLSLDIGPKFKEARHEKGFKAVSAGTIWTIRTEKPSSTADNQTPEKQAPTGLPNKLAHLLNQLNIYQQAYDRSLEQIASLRKQTFADWYKYMFSAYPPEDTRDKYPDIDELKDFIEKADLVPIKRQEIRINALNTVRKNHVDKIYQAVAELQLLSLEDIEDWEVLQKQLTDQARTPELAHLLTLLPASIHSQMEQITPFDEAQKDNLLEALNTQLQHVNFYKEDSFRGLKLSVEAQTLQGQVRAKEKPLAHEVLRLNRLILENLLPSIRKSSFYSLRQVPAPRFWQANDPVVLISDPNLKSTPRHGEDGRQHEEGLLECYLIEASINNKPSTPLTKETILSVHRALIEELETRKFTENGERIGFSQLTEQPWHPFLLEWATEVFPVVNKVKPHNYNEASISDTYELADTKVDLDLKPTKSAIRRSASIFTGRSIMLPHANELLKNELESFLEKQLLPEYYKAKEINVSERDNDYFEKNLKDIIPWFEGAKGAFKEPLREIFKVYQHLNSENHNAVLTQSLAGFNEALLMHKQTLQLPIDDPIGFDAYQPFTKEVASAVGKQNRSAPLPLNDFHPIRSGVLKLLELRLVDTFGRVQKILPKANKVIVAEAMTTAGQEHLVSLKPRITQPARLNFRWLSANHGGNDIDEQEMNIHPATSPICGWFLPNMLDGSLMVYNQQGEPLGSIDKNAQWEPAPGYQAITPKDIVNPHLNKLVSHVLEQGQDFFKYFLTAIESALETIDPDNFIHHEALALLMGRPIAVVRASLNLELQGLPAINEDWNILRQDMAHFYKHEHEDQFDLKPARETNNFTKVQFPIRLGEYGQLHDGLVGYWIEAEGNYESHTFYAPQTPNNAQNKFINHSKIRIHQDRQPVNILQAIDDKPHTVTMLLDPRGAVHATSGILPTKALSLPADQYLNALKNLEVTFLTAPVLTPQNELDIPLPQEPGYDWSWLSKEHGNWTDSQAINKINPQANFSQQSIIEGWLKLTKHDD